MNTKSSLVILCSCLLLLTAQAFSAARAAKKDFFTRSGDWIQVLLPLSTASRLYRAGAYTDLYSFTAANMTTGLQTHALKHLIHSKRPNGGKHSFPSGHTSFVFSSPSYLFFRYGAQESMLEFILASTVAASRVHGLYHHTRDVLAGAILAAANQYFFYHHYQLTLLPKPHGISLHYLITPQRVSRQ